jgi:hypothetical protein
MDAASVEIGSAPSIARHLAFVIPAGDREPLFAGRAVRLGDAQCMMLHGTALSILPIVMAPLSAASLRCCLSSLRVAGSKGCFSRVSSR